jgi:hypothetical protein
VTTPATSLRLTAVGLLAAALLSACTNDAAPSRGGIGIPASPDGTRWQGINDVVVAVPRDWTTEADPCASSADSVRMLGPLSLAAPCSPVGTRGSVLQVASSGAGVLSATGRLRHRTSVGGVGVRHGGVACRASGAGPCTLVFAVPSADATFQITYRGPRPAAFVRWLMRSLTMLPDGSTTVPVVEYGESVDDAKARLEQAGLVGKSPDVNFPHYATGTTPAAGHVVPVGSTVELSIGDG